MAKKGSIMALISGAAYGIMPLWVVSCYSRGLSQLALITLRSGITVILLIPFVYKDMKVYWAIGKKLWKLMALSATNLVTTFLLFSSYKYISTGLATSIHFLYPILVALICFFAFGQRMTRTKLCCLVICITGIVLLLDKSESINPNGVILALLSGITYSVYVVGIEHVCMDKLSSVQLAFGLEICYLTCGLVMGLFAGAFQTDITAAGWSIAIIGGVTISVFGYVFFIFGVRYAGAQTASIISTAEPMISVFIGAFILKERFTFPMLFGMALILLAVIISTFSAGPSVDKKL